MASKLQELIDRLCPDGVEYRNIGSFAECYSGATPKTGLAKYWDNGTIPWMSSGEVNQQIVTKIEKRITQAGYDSCSTRMVPINSVVIALAGQGKTRGLVALTRTELCTNQSLCAIVPGNSVCSEFLYYYLQSQYQNLRAVSSGDGTRGGLNLRMVREYLIPLPPLEIQREIVQILDNFAELTAELTAELEKRKKQYEYYRRSLLGGVERGTSDVERWPTVKLGDIGRVAMCKRILKQETSSEGDIPFYKIGTFGKTADAFISNEKFLEYTSKYSYPKKGDVLISAAGTIGRAIIFDGEPAYYQDSNIVWLEHDESKALNKFLYYCYQLSPWHVSVGGTIPRLYNDNILKATIPLPPLAEQKRIVDILDRFDRLCNDLTAGLPAEIAARRKQYEYYRDKLLSFRRKGVA